MSRSAAWLSWLALVVAFSPVLADLAQHLASDPPLRYALLFAPLLVVALRSVPASEPAAPRGYSWLAAALLIELLALRVDLARVARPALAIGVIGLARSEGLSQRAAALAFWLVPVPGAVLALASPWLATALLAFAAPLAGLGGLALEADPLRLLAGSQGLELRPVDLGLPLAALLSGLGWYAGVRGRWAARRLLTRVLGWGVLALPVQLAGLGLAGGLLAAVDATAARAALDHLWIPVAAVALLWIEGHEQPGRLAVPPGEAARDRAVTLAGPPATHPGPPRRRAVAERVRATVQSDRREADGSR